MLLNLVTYACLMVSTSISLPTTIKKGERASPDFSQDGSAVKLCGHMDGGCRGTAALPSSCDESNPAPGMEKAPTSTTLRMPMMSSMIQRWKRSTMSAHVNWNRLSFSKRLKTVLLISTN